MTIIYLGLGGLFLSIAGYLYWRGERNFMSAPLSLFFIMLAIVHGGVPALEHFQNLERFSPTTQNSTHFAAVVLTLAAGLSAALGYSVSAPISAERTPSAEPPGSDPSLLQAPQTGGIDVWLFCLFIALPSLFALMILAARFSLYDPAFLQNRITAISDSTFWLLLSNAAVLIPSYFFLRFQDRYNTLIVFAISVFLIGLCSALIIGTGSRNSIFIAAVLWGVTILSCARETPRHSPRQYRLINLIMGIIIIGAGLGLMAFQQIRADLTSGDTLYSGQSRASHDALIEGIVWNFGNHQLTTFVIEDDAPPLYGATYLAGAVNLIPRSVWPTKPVGAGPRIKNRVRPGSYVVGGYGISSYTTGLLTESYMNFAVLGPPVISFLLGVGIARIRRSYLYAASSLTKILHIYLMVSVCVTFMYSEFAGWFGRNLAVILLLLIPIYIEKNLTSRHGDQPRSYEPNRKPTRTAL